MISTIPKKLKLISVLIWTPLLLVFPGCVTLEEHSFKHEQLKDGGFKVHVLKNETPSPTIILAHGCDANHIFEHYLNSAKEIKSWGYNVVLVDSFSKRGDNNICKFPRTLEISAEIRAADLQKTGKWVKSQSWHKGKIGAIGYSHGGAAMVALSQENTRNNLFSEIKENQFSAIVAYYPACILVFKPTVDADTPIMIHLGEKDDWTPVSMCLNIDAKTNRPTLVGKNYFVFKYANATHAFDKPAPDRTYEGHYLRFDPEANRVSKQRTRDFFDYHLH